MRFGCRISDVVTYGVLLYFLGLEGIAIAFGVSMTIAYTADFWGQKLFTFGGRKDSWRLLFMEFFVYLCVRGTNVVAALFIFFIANLLGLSTITSALLVIAIVWPLSFPLYKWAFTKSRRFLVTARRNIRKIRA